jgi:predicted nucleic acid-binding protein
MWLNGWSYRKTLTVTGSTAGAQTDYTLLFRVHYGTGTDGTTPVNGYIDVYLNSHCNTDFSDLRFTTLTGTQLDYSVTEQVNSDYALVAVKTDVIPANPSTAQFYFYYGNSNASSLSSDYGFMFFDDFNDNSIDTDKWEIYSTTGATVTEENSQLKMYRDGSSDNSYLVIAPLATSKTVFNYGVAISAKMLFSSGGTYKQLMFGLLNASNTYIVAMEGKWSTSWDGWDDIYRYIKCISGSTSEAVLDTASHDAYWHTYQLMFDYPNGTVKFLLDSTDKGTAGFVSNASTSITLHLRTHYSSLTAFFDNVYARKYVNPEPTVSSWSSEEEATVVSITVTETFTVNENTLKINKNIKASESITFADVFKNNKNNAVFDSTFMAEALKANKKLEMYDSTFLFDILNKACLLGVNEQISIIDLLTKLAKTKKITDSFSCVEALTSNKNLAVTDVFILLEHLRSDKNLFSTENVSFVDAFLLNKNLVLHDVSTIVDVIEKLRSLNVADNTVLTDAVTYSKQILLKENINFADALFIHCLKKITENMATTDNQQVNKTLKTFDSTVANETQYLTKNLNLKETFYLIETVLKHYTAQLTDDLALKDNVLKNAFYTLTDPIVLIENIRLVQAIKQIAEIVKATEIVYGNKTFRLQENVSATDKNWVNKQLYVLENVTVEDLFLRNKRITLIDNVNSQEDFTVINLLQVNDSLTLAELVVTGKIYYALLVNAKKTSATTISVTKTQPLVNMNIQKSKPIIIEAKKQ